jgi:hypothetical protein
MKRNLLLTVLLMLNTAAFAGNDSSHGNHGGNSGGGFLGNVSATAGSTATASNGPVSVSVDGDDYGHIPVSSAIAPSVSSNVTCPIVTPSSKAGSVWFFSGSGTTGTTLNAICVAFHLNQPQVVEKMTCNASKEYYEANCTCSDSCMPPEMEAK